MISRKESKNKNRVVKNKIAIDQVNQKYRKNGSRKTKRYKQKKIIGTKSFRVYFLLVFLFKKETE